MPGSSQGSVSALAVAMVLVQGSAPAFWQGSVSPATCPASQLCTALLCSRGRCCCRRGCPSQGIFGLWEGWCLRQGCWPGPGWLQRARGDLTCRIISKALLCATWLDAATFIPGYFRTTCARAWPWLLQPREGPWARRQEMSHVGWAGDVSILHPSSHRGLPTSDAIPMTGDASPLPRAAGAVGAAAAGLGWSGADRANTAGRRFAGG